MTTVRADKNYRQRYCSLCPNKLWRTQRVCVSCMIKIMDGEIPGNEAWKKPWLVLWILSEGSILKMYVMCMYLWSTLSSKGKSLEISLLQCSKNSCEASHIHGKTIIGFYPPYQRPTPFGLVLVKRLSGRVRMYPRRYIRSESKTPFFVNQPSQIF